MLAGDVSTSGVIIHCVTSNHLLQLPSLSNCCESKWSTEAFFAFIACLPANLIKIVLLLLSFVAFVVNIYLFFPFFVRFGLFLISFRLNSHSHCFTVDEFWSWSIIYLDL